MVEWISPTKFLLVSIRNFGFLRVLGPSTQQQFYRITLVSKDLSTVTFIIYSKIYKSSNIKIYSAYLFLPKQSNAMFLRQYANRGLGAPKLHSMATAHQRQSLRHWMFYVSLYKIQTCAIFNCPQIYEMQHLELMIINNLNKIRMSLSVWRKNIIPPDNLLIQIPPEYEAWATSCTLVLLIFTARFICWY